MFSPSNSDFKLGNAWFLLHSIEVLSCLIRYASLSHFTRALLLGTFILALSQLVTQAKIAKIRNARFSCISCDI